MQVQAAQVHPEVFSDIKTEFKDISSSVGADQIQVKMYRAPPDAVTRLLRFIRADITQVTQQQNKATRSIRCLFISL